MTSSPSLFTRNSTTVTHCILYNLPKSEFSNRLQLIQHSVARAIVKAPKSFHRSPIFISLHSLKINGRIEYKLLSVSLHKVLTVTELTYLNNFIFVQPSPQKFRVPYFLQLYSRVFLLTGIILDFLLLLPNPALSRHRDHFSLQKLRTKRFLNVDFINIFWESQTSVLGGAMAMAPKTLALPMPRS